MIQYVDPRHDILASDLGQMDNPSPPEGLRVNIMMLLERGFEPEESRTMLTENPTKLLGFKDDKILKRAEYFLYHLELVKRSE